MSDQLAIYTFGNLAVQANDQAVPFRGRKTPALLVYLACNPRPHPREVLAEMLWEDRTQAQSLANLRVVLTDLRHTVGSHVCVTRETVSLMPEGEVWLDATAFEGLLEEAARDPARLEEALALYRGDFLDGFYIGSQGFEDWTLLERERLRFRVIEALDTLIASHLDAGNYAGSITHATRLLRMDTLREKSYRQIMRLLALSGEREAALAQYETCCRVLRDELGVTPTPETVQLYNDIRSGILVERPRAVSPPNGAEPVSYLAARLRHNLPVQATSFVGREDDIAAILDRLAEPGCRLLTLVGPGGMGKTRLALAVAERLVDTFADGVFFVPLVSLASSEGIVFAIAAALQIQFHHGQESAEQQLLDYLQDKELLLVLDNFEHLLDGVDLIDRMLTAASRVTLLITSREVLCLGWEWLFEVHGLSRPNSPEGAVLGQGDAIRLFVERARRVRPGFRWEDELVHITHIAQYVDGMPLGIEIAASWLRMLPCDAIAGELFDLDMAQRDMPERHHSLRVLFDQTWDRLSPPQQRALRQLSVFRGGFTRDAAESVAGASLPILVTLVHKSLLRFDPDRRRYDFHELLRQYASEKLSASPDEQRMILDRHGTYFAHFVSQHEGQFFAGVFQDTLMDVDNFWMAWDWALAGHHFAEIELLWPGMLNICERQNWVQKAYELFSSGVDALANVASLPESARLFHVSVAIKGWFSILTGHPNEGPALIRQGVNALRQLGWSKERVEAEECSLWMGLEKNPAVIRQIIDDCIAYCRDSNEPDHIPFFLMQGAYLEASEQRPEEATIRFRESIALARELRAPYPMAVGLQAMAVHLCEQGQLEMAQQPLQEALTICQAHDFRRTLAGSLNLFAYLEMEQDHDLAAQRYAEDAVATARETNNRNYMLMFRDTLALTKYSMGAYEDALRLFQENLAMEVDMGFIPATHYRLGFCHFKLNEITEARHHLLQILPLIDDSTASGPIMAVNVILGGALLLAAWGRKSTALEWAGITYHHHMLDKHQRDETLLLAELEAELGPEAVAQAIERGKTRDLLGMRGEVLAELERGP